MITLVKRTIRKTLKGTILGFGGGIGDHLLCTTVAREIKKRECRRIFMVSQHQGLFRRNPDIAGVLRPGSDSHRVMGRVIEPRNQLTLVYEEHDKLRDIGVSPKEHIVAIMCRQARITGTISVRPYFFLDADEQLSANKYRNCIAIQTSGCGAKNHIPNKEWLPERFFEVAEQLLQRHEVVQVGNISDPPVPCRFDLRGRTTIRQLASVLSVARAYVGQVGFLMHLARAVNCPAVIVYGGREAPNQTGYICNVNLYKGLPCAPCWKWWNCDHERLCMSEISTSDVVNGVSLVLEMPKSHLPVQRITL